jgi:hypothetical protein
MYATSEVEPCPMSDAPLKTATRPERSTWSCTADCGIRLG